MTSADLRWVLSSATPIAALVLIGIVIGTRSGEGEIAPLSVNGGPALVLAAILFVSTLMSAWWFGVRGTAAVRRRAPALTALKIAALTALVFSVACALVFAGGGPLDRFATTFAYALAIALCFLFAPLWALQYILCRRRYAHEAGAER